MEAQANKINSKWIRGTRKYFKSFLDETGFPHPEKMGSRGPAFDYPEWLIMFISVLAVKCKVKSYVGIHKLTTRYWKDIAQGTGLKPISERQLRDRLKKIGCESGRTPGFIFQVFPEEYLN
jgi:hypothetical protein